MPELPDVEVYRTAIERNVLGRTLQRVRLGNPFVLRSVRPPLAESYGRRVDGVERLGKRLVIALEGELFLVIHLMIAGRLLWKQPGAKLPGKAGLAAFDFADGTLILREAGSKRRASLHCVAGRDAVEEQFSRGGLEVLDCDLEAFGKRLRSENHTVKRSLTDPRLFSGIGNAYSDEILHRARLSPLKWTSRLDDEAVSRLYAATRSVLEEWTARLQEEAAGGFPEKVTAFRSGMAVHGRYREPCPDCGQPVQRIVYAENECNYCAHCQNSGRLLADRALSRILHDDWPKTLEEISG